jgi:ADP-ribose pyrophosphatase YjhB (NUDIX family)
VVGVGLVILRAGAAEPEVLLIRRGQPPRQGEWSIPGGRQELGETVRETAVREALEETGIAVGNLRLIDVVDAFGRHPDGSLRTQWVLVDFRADCTGGEAVAGGDAAAVAWVPLSDLDRYGLWHETVRVIRDGAALP